MSGSEMQTPAPSIPRSRMVGSQRDRFSWLESRHRLRAGTHGLCYRQSLLNTPLGCSERTQQQSTTSHFFRPSQVSSATPNSSWKQQGVNTIPRDSLRSAWSHTLEPENHTHVSSSRTTPVVTANWFTNPDKELLGLPGCISLRGDTSTSWAWSRDNSHP